MNLNAHIPVLINPILEYITPENGCWVDGTFGAGGYSCALLDAGAKQVVGIDRDPNVIRDNANLMTDYGDRFQLIEGKFSQMDQLVNDLGIEKVDGVVLDIGVSSMQLDQAERGFSFMKNGPLDMRMSAKGMSAADIVNEASEEELAEILYLYGDERASRRIARNIVVARKKAELITTESLKVVIERSLPRPKPGQLHPATRSFQALRIAVNDELGELYRGLLAAEQLLKEGGILAVVSFHSLEDRMVKRFMNLRSSRGGSGNRYAPAEAEKIPTFEKVTRRAVTANDEEVSLNPRARSAKLRIARRLGGVPVMFDPTEIGMPQTKFMSGG